MSNLKAYILWRFAEESGLYNSWMPLAPLPCQIVKSPPADWTAPEDAGIIITHMHYRWDEIHTLRKICSDKRIPILILADGILEYRNIWEHPELADGCVFQPVIGHKLACIGQGQTQVIESWGNIGKCETVGLPRLDQLSEITHTPISTSGPFRILIATANTPAFNDEQRQSVVESLTHIQQRLSVNSKVNGRPVKVIWRLTDGLDQELGIPADPENESSLSEIIDRVDAVITTPSTLYLESILKKRPTALLDFHNTPHYVNSAWMINAPKHFNDIVRELAAPPAAKMLFQETTLHCQLRSDGMAGQRMAELISAMVEEGQQARSENRDIKMPFRILADQRKGFPAVPAQYKLEKQYPENTVFPIEDLAQLQLELNLAIKRLGELPKELNEKVDHYDEMKEMRDATLSRLEDTLAQNQTIMNMNVQIRERNQGLQDRVNSLMEKVVEQRERIGALLKQLGLPVPPKKKNPSGPKPPASNSICGEDPGTNNPPNH